MSNRGVLSEQNASISCFFACSTNKAQKRNSAKCFQSPYQRHARLKISKYYYIPIDTISLMWYNHYGKNLSLLWDIVYTIINAHWRAKF